MGWWRARPAPAPRPRSVVERPRVPLGRVLVPAGAAVQRARRRVVHGGLQADAGRAFAARERGGRIEQCARHAAAPRAFGHVQVVEDPGARGAHRGEHRIQLHEPDRVAAAFGQQQHRFAARHAFGQPLARARQVGGLAIETAIGIEQRGDGLQVVGRGAADRDGGHGDAGPRCARRDGRASSRARTALSTSGDCPRAGDRPCTARCISFRSGGVSQSRPRIVIAATKRACRAVALLSIAHGPGSGECFPRRAREPQRMPGRVRAGAAQPLSVSRASSSAWCSLARRSTSASRSPCITLGRSYRVRPSMRWSVIRPCGKL